MFAWVGRLIRNLRAQVVGVPDHLRFVAEAMKVLGPQVLGARDLDDLDEQIDAVIDRPEFRNLSAQAADLILGGKLTGFGSPVAYPPELLATVGAGQAMLLAETDSLASALASAYGEFVSALTNDQQRYSVASLALGEAVALGRALEPWIARALCERVRDGLRASLRLIASIPGSDVSLALIRAEDRLDLGQLDADHRTAVDIADAQLGQARASGSDVFPPPGLHGT
ncbi:MAG: hypothetical protein WCJ30_05730 [Deltaproteobacteria bacterium]